MDLVPVIKITRMHQAINFALAVKTTYRSLQSCRSFLFLKVPFVKHLYTSVLSRDIYI